MRVAEQMIEFDTMLNESVQRVGATVRNLRQEMGGFSSMTPGNGSPGAGKGGTATISISDPDDPVDPDGVDVPVTSVESQALFGRDVAGDRLADLDRAAHRCVDMLGDILTTAGVDPGPDFAGRSCVGPDRVVVLAFARMRRCMTAGVVPARPVADVLDRQVAEIFGICRVWGYRLTRAEVPKDRAELLAVDLTGTLCRSHLRVGERRDRDRGELCHWCRKFEALEGFVPPVDLVRIHVEFGRVRDDQIRPFRKSHRDRIKQRARR